jgi:hypothetical protein
VAIRVFSAEICTVLYRAEALFGGVPSGWRGGATAGRKIWDALGCKTGVDKISL